jgi:hypothetical protein
MRKDIRGIGGFFEDLPVLLFVLAGVLSVLSSACWTNAYSSEEAEFDDVRVRALAMMDSVLLRLSEYASVPTEAQVGNLNLSALARQQGLDSDCCVSIWMLHPEVYLLASTGNIPEDDRMYGSSSSESRLFNVIDGSGRIGVGEIYVIVWCS